MFLVIAGSVCLWYSIQPSTQQLLRDANAAVRLGKLTVARQLAEQVLRRDPRLAEAHFLSGSIALREHRPTDAISAFESAAEFGTKDVAAKSLDQLAGLLLEAKRPTAAENAFRRLLALRPQDSDARFELSFLLCATGRGWEARKLLLLSVQEGEVPVDHLLWMCGPEYLLNQTAEESLKSWESASPDDPLPYLGQAAVAARASRWSDVERLARRSRDRDPASCAAHAQLGMAQFELRREAEFPEWLRNLPENASDSPDLWLVRGKWAEHFSQHKAAARCFWECVRLDPENSVATFRLARLLKDLNHPQWAERFEQRTKLLKQFSDAGVLASKQRMDADRLREVGELAERLGRKWEALGWYHHALRLGAGDFELAGRLQRLQARLKPGGDPTEPDAIPTRDIDLSSWPLPDPPKSGVHSPAVATNRHEQECLARFREATADAGIRFTYFNGAAPSLGRAYMFEFSGGGVAALDYNGDYWPDIYLSQGCRWPPQPNQREHMDKLFRNLGNGTFEDVTANTGIQDWGLGQGVAVGDLDQDGFPDLYVGNIGDNRLFHNNGDGTFSDVTETSGLSHSNTWTSSPMFADFNNDALPDLYLATYVQGADLHTRDCGRNGHLQQCDPKFFDAAPDRIFRNLGDGRFADETESSGINAEGGKGLGIVGIDLEGHGLPDIFVANDLTANFQFRNHSEIGGPLKFVESGVLSGFAFSGDGVSQASMGIAVGDANGDGQQDLLVTNFLDEGSTLYVQQSGQAFADQTRRVGLFEKSRTRLSFGTQFLDAELDGRPDLVVASGHINDFAYQGLPYRMPLDYYQNLEAGRFTFIPPDVVGKAFHEESLGRALATMDWNRDGHPDFAVTYVDRPFGLYENSTSKSGHGVTLRLIGTKSNREGCFARVTARARDRIWHPQLTAGDGYQSSNERSLILGLGSTDHLDTLEIDWPSGIHQKFLNVQADRELLAIEDQPELVTLRVQPIERTSHASPMRLPK